jgi:hypothetical protein
MQWVYDPETAVLQQFYTAIEYLSPDDRQTLQPWVKATAKKYSWTGMRFDSPAYP